MKTYTISYTTDLRRTVQTMTVLALDYTKAYLAAIVALPFDVAILEAKEEAPLPA
ncbi:MAG: hypothetical protein IKB38_09270 [Clostridia bacterium]|nr:hypothetical protein [Clostridia bacterium]